MSCKIMTPEEFQLALDRLGFKMQSKNNHPFDKGYSGFNQWLDSGRERGNRYGSGKKRTPTEIAMLLRLMIETGYTPEMVAALPGVENKKGRHPVKGSG